MKNTLLIFTLGVLLASCDNREIFLKSIIVNPEIELVNKNGKSNTIDSIKYTLKSTKKVSQFSITLSGNNTDKTVNVKTVNGSGTLSLNGQTGDGERKMDNGTYLLTYTPSATGTTLINLELTDNFKNKKEVNTQVVTFDNLLPVAVLSLNNIAVVDPKEYILDASASFDRDNAYGGFISTYTFKIGNKTITTDKPSIKWIFNSPGNYEVGVTVTDSDGDKDVYSKIYAIN